MSAPAITVSNAELVTARELMRDFSATLAPLDSGTVEKLVVLQGNKMRAVILTPERWSELQAPPRRSIDAIWRSGPPLGVALSNR